MLQLNDLTAQMWVYGVEDPAFRPQDWWRKRLYAKIWFREFSKLVWVELSGQ